MTIRVRGTNRDGDDRELTVGGIAPAELAELLYLGRWKYAVLTADDGENVGGVAFSTPGLRRTWWGKPE